MMRLILFLGFLLSLSDPMLNAQQNIRFGVLGLFQPKELLIEQAGSQVIAGHATNQDFLLDGELGHRRLLVRADGDKVTVHGITATLFTAASRTMAPVRFRLTVPGRMRRIYDGRLAITAHRGVLIAVITMDRESAVASIVASEMPVNAPLEALKAQAIAARSFLVAGPRHHDFDFCDTTHCQFLRSPDDVTSQVLEAVNATRGLALSWHGKTVAALYASRCGGQTRSLEEVGMHPHGEYPYYAVECQWCRRHPVQWQTRLDRNSKAPPPSDEPARIAKVRHWGWSALPGSSFSTQKEAGEIVIKGTSIGHSLGMCQFGAMGMAASGADFRSILTHYYPNADLVRLP